MTSSPLAPPSPRGSPRGSIEEDEEDAEEEPGGPWLIRSPWFEGVNPSLLSSSSSPSPSPSPPPPSSPPLPPMPGPPPLSASSLISNRANVSPPGPHRGTRSPTDNISCAHTDVKPSSAGPTCRRRCLPTHSTYLRHSRCCRENSSITCCPTRSCIMGLPPHSPPRAPPATPGTPHTKAGTRWWTAHPRIRAGRSHDLGSNAVTV